MPGDRDFAFQDRRNRLAMAQRSIEWERLGVFDLKQMRLC